MGDNELNTFSFFWSQISIKWIWARIHI